jgi:hypothetical protein
MKEQESIIYMSGTIKVCMEHLFYWFIRLLIIYYICGSQEDRFAGQKQAGPVN